MTRRAGGHVDRGDGRGWVLDDSPAPAVEPFVPQAHQPAPAVQVAGGWVLNPPAEPVEKPAAERPSDAEVRAWAKDAGVAVPARGRLPQDVVDQYLAAREA